MILSTNWMNMLCNVSLQGESLLRICNDNQWKSFENRKHYQKSRHVKRLKLVDKNTGIQKLMWCNHSSLTAKKRYTLSKINQRLKANRWIAEIENICYGLLSMQLYDFVCCTPVVVSIRIGLVNSRAFFHRRRRL